jgi:hypothetical protein
MNFFLKKLTVLEANNLLQATIFSTILVRSGTLAKCSLSNNNFLQFKLTSSFTCFLSFFNIYLNLLQKPAACEFNFEPAAMARASYGKSRPFVKDPRDETQL